MLKSIVNTVAYVVLALCLSVTVAQADEFPDYSEYYLQPDNAKIVEVLNYMNTRPDNTGPEVYAPLIGFLAGAIQTKPDIYTETIRDAELSPVTAVMVGRALWLAGREKTLPAFNAAHKIAEEEVTAFHAAYPADLRDLVRVTSPSDLDVLWGAFYGSGDITHVQKVVHAFMERLQGDRYDADDIYAVGSADALTPEGQNRLIVALMRYDEDSIADLSLGGMALWGLGKNAAVDDMVADYLRNIAADTPDPDAQRLLNRSVYEHKYGKHTVVRGEADGLGGFLFTTDRKDFTLQTNYDIAHGTRKKPDIRKVFHHGDTVYLPMFIRLDPQTGETLDVDLTITTPAGKKITAKDVVEKRAAVEEGIVTDHTMTVTTGDRDVPGIYLIHVVLSQEGRSLALDSSYLLESASNTQ